MIPIITSLLWEGLVDVQSVSAATITVTSTANNGAGTLRAALTSATDGDTIDATGISGRILLTSGELTVSHSVAIVGPGPGTLAVDGNAAGRVFHIINGVTARISSLTVSNGLSTGSSPSGYGAGILNDLSALTVSNCAISGNSAGSGGGIYNRASVSSATLTVIASTLSGNSVFDNGGGIYNVGSGGGTATLTVSNCTFSGNSAHSGGGIWSIGQVSGGTAVLTVVGSVFSGNNAATGAGGGITAGAGVGGSGTATVSATTFSANSAGAEGGGIAHVVGGGGSSTLMVNACTFSGNSAGVGGGIYNLVVDFNGSASVANLEIGDTILKAGTSGVNIANDGATVTSHGYNLSTDGGSGFLTAGGDQINTDPMLGPLQNNGGRTLTHALLPVSPAIDKGKRDAIPALSLNTDQRGLSRPVDDPITAPAPGGDNSDIGAFEAQPNELVIWVDFNALCPGNGTFASPYCKLTNGVNTALPGETISIKTAGSSLEKPTISKPLTIRAAGGAATIGQ